MDLRHMLKEADRQIDRADTRAEKEKYHQNVMNKLYLRKDAVSDSDEDAYIRLNIIQQKYMFLFFDEDELGIQLDEWEEETKNTESLDGDMKMYTRRAGYED